jgi:hypothetical protein
VKERLLMDNLKWKTASIQITDKDIEYIRKLTSRNNHTEAYLFGAELLKVQKLVRLFETIQTIILIEGYLPPGASDYQYNLYKQLMEYAKRVLTKEQYEQFHSAF